MFFLSLGHVGNRLEHKVNFKIYDVATWLSKIAMHILTNISRSKRNQAMEFGKLIESNLKNIFLEKSYTKHCGETVP